jgi:hypothetical protein
MVLKRAKKQNIILLNSNSPLPVVINDIDISTVERFTYITAKELVSFKGIASGKMMIISKCIILIR